ncbi:MAG: hypothetical protein H7239_12415 [Flavobacterium sp.]|nr:hypothetical protein [Flavobacterium sp.]
MGFSMLSTFRIPSKLYFELYQKGGDKLIATYSVLKQSRNKEKQYFSFTSKNNKKVSGYSLLRNKTNISLHTLKKYIPTLINAGLCSFNDIGDFILLGNSKTKELYSSHKLVPIIIGKNLVHTAYNSMAVRLYSSEAKQLRQIEIKRNQSELLKRKDNPRSLKELKAIRKILKNENRNDFFIDKSVLSLQSYAYIKDNSNSKAKGYYWKNKLKQKNIIVSKRRFNNIKQMTLKEFLFLKSNSKIPKLFLYRSGWLVEEIVSEFNTIKTIDKSM